VSTVPTLEQCHETAGNLIALQSRRLVELAGFRSRVRDAVKIGALTETERLSLVIRALELCP
jgi:hypothetical protein